MELDGGVAAHRSGRRTGGRQANAEAGRQQTGQKGGLVKRSNQAAVSARNAEHEVRQAAPGGGLSCLQLYEGRQATVLVGRLQITERRTRGTAHRRSRGDRQLSRMTESPVSIDTQHDDMVRRTIWDIVHTIRDTRRTAFL